VDIALRSGIATGDRAEYADTSYTVSRGDAQDLIALVSEDFVDSHCSMVTIQPHEWISLARRSAGVLSCRTPTFCQGTTAAKTRAEPAGATAALRPQAFKLSTERA